MIFDRMEICILRKVPYRLPGTSRLVWAVVLCEHEGQSLLFVQRPDSKRSNALVIATENVAERIFETVNTSSFYFSHQDIADVGNKLRALGEGLSAEE